MSLRLLAIGLLSLFALPSVRADFVEQNLIDNFGSGDSFNTSFGYVIGGANDIEQGPLFTVADGTFFLRSIDAAIGTFTGGDSVSLSVYTEIDGAPGHVLETITVSGLPNFGGGFPPTTFEFSGKTILRQDQSYFLIGTAADDLEFGNSQLLWAWNDTGDQRLIQVRTGGGPWEKSQNTVAPAFRIVGSAIPEPGCFVVLAVFALSVARVRQARLRNDKTNGFDLL